MNITVEEAEIHHLELVEDYIRPADMREWYGASGLPFTNLAYWVLGGDDYKRVALGPDGTPYLFWGCDEDGDMWMFATEEAERIALSLHRALYPKVLDELTERHGRLTALADARNTKHHRWLKWMGFEWVRDEVTDPFGLTYKLYVKEH